MFSFFAISFKLSSDVATGSVCDFGKFGVNLLYYFRVWESLRKLPFIPANIFKDFQFRRQFQKFVHIFSICFGVGPNSTTKSWNINPTKTCLVTSTAQPLLLNPSTQVRGFSSGFQLLRLYDRLEHGKGNVATKMLHRITKGKKKEKKHSSKEVCQNIGYNHTN